MAVSVFDLFSIGIGPSSSHTVGPMRAAKQFLKQLPMPLNEVSRIRVEFFGSLGQTGIGHGSDVAVMLGLLGERCDKVDTNTVNERIDQIKQQGLIKLLNQKEVSFDYHKDLLFYENKYLPKHANAMTFTAFDQNQNILTCDNYYSVGGGFIINENTNEQVVLQKHKALPFDFKSAEQLLAMANKKQCSISQIMRKNESVWLSDVEIDQKLDEIWQAMSHCIDNGLTHKGVLPGGLNVNRRAAQVVEKLTQQSQVDDPLGAMDWVNVFALAVNEENAAGGRVVTAPTNGAAGIIPAVMKYFQTYYAKDNKTWHREFLLTAGAIGILYKLNASISGAEVGCQGEVGVACSMAAAGLVAVQSGTIQQIENAAEIGMEHNLGLTCDPVGGLVQIPCIERNAMGAVKAINAARLAKQGDGNQKVSLDKIIKTMRETGADMKSKYKETSKGGLAVNIIVC